MVVWYLVVVSSKCDLPAGEGVPALLGGFGGLKLCTGEGRGSELMTEGKSKGYTSIL